jgi:hypothetical protein
METAAAHPTTAADLVALLLDIVPAHRHEETLCKHLSVQQANLKAWEEQHSRHVEEGWEDAWKHNHTKLTALVAEITRVLAERFGR